MAITGKPKPSTIVPPVDRETPVARQAREDALISRGGGSAGNDPDEQPLLTDEEKLKMEYLQLRPPTFVVNQLDEMLNVLYEKTGRKQARLAFCMEAVLKSLKEQVAEHGIEFGPNATAPSGYSTARRRRSKKASATID